MKITIDNQKKTIQVEEDVNVFELVNELKYMLPNGEWKKFTFVVKNVLEFKNPISISQPREPIIVPYYETGTPYNPPFTITCSTTTKE